MIYLDSCICIYAVVQKSRFHTAVLAALSQEPQARFAISHLVMAECLIGPIKSCNSFVVQDFEALFSRTIVLDLPEAVYRQAAQIRAMSALKMPDALHLACAQFHNCDSLWTNDDRLNQIGGKLVRSLFQVKLLGHV